MTLASSKTEKGDSSPKSVDRWRAERFRLEGKDILWTGRNKNVIKMCRGVLQGDSLPKC